MSAICTSDFIRHVYRSFLLMGCYRTPKQLFSNQFAVYLIKSGAEAHAVVRAGTGIIQAEGGRSRKGRTAETRPPERHIFPLGSVKVYIGILFLFFAVFGQDSQEA